MSKWSNVYILWLGNEHDINVSLPARAFATKYGDQTNRKFSDQNPPPQNWTWWNSGSLMLSNIKFDDKLMIFAHATAEDIGEIGSKMSPEAFSDELYAHGLTEVGLITFHTRLTERERFLQKFKFQCRENRIKIGWLKGYRGLVTLFEDPAAVHPEERIRNFSSGGFKSGDSRFVIVEGTVKLSKGGRYGS
jgi:hypothetical protein